MERRMKSEEMVVGNCIAGGLFRLLVKSTVPGGSFLIKNKKRCLKRCVNTWLQKDSVYWGVVLIYKVGLHRISDVSFVDELWSETFQKRLLKQLLVTKQSSKIQVINHEYNDDRPNHRIALLASASAGLKASSHQLIRGSPFVSEPSRLLLHRRRSRATNVEA